jgi:tryptophanyl-tRNA synthetase
VTLTGIKPTGELHLGNYVGAVKPLVRLGGDPSREVYVFLADLHALNTRPDPATLRERSRRLAAALLACGLDRPNVRVYRQSQVPAVSELAILLSNIAGKGCSTGRTSKRRPWRPTSRPDATSTMRSPWACTDIRC